MLSTIKKFRLTTTREKNWLSQLKKYKYITKVNILENDVYKTYATIVKTFEQKWHNSTFKKHEYFNRFDEKNYYPINSRIIHHHDKNQNMDSILNLLDHKDYDNNNYYNFEFICRKLEENYCLNNNSYEKPDAKYLFFNQNDIEIIIEVEPLKQYYNKIQKLSTDIFKLRMKHNVKKCNNYNQLNMPLDPYEVSINGTLIGFKNNLPYMILTPLGTINICNDPYSFEYHENTENFRKELNKLLKLEKISDEKYEDTGYGFCHHSPAFFEIKNTEFIFPDSDITKLNLNDQDNYYKLWKNIKPQARFSLYKIEKYKSYE